MRKRLIMMVGGAALLAGCAPEAPKTPLDAAARFYAVLDALGVRQAPPPPAVEALRPFVTGELATALALVTQRPDTVRDAADQDAWFGSLPEGYTTATPRTAIERGETTLVVMAMSNTKEKPAVSWPDTIVVVAEQGRLVVADLRYGAGWEFARRGSLLSLLKTRAGVSAVDP